MSLEQFEKILAIGPKTADTQIYISEGVITIGPARFTEKDQVDKFIHELIVVKELLPMSEAEEKAQMDDMTAKREAVYRMGKRDTISGKEDTP